MKEVTKREESRQNSIETGVIIDNYDYQADANRRLKFSVAQNNKIFAEERGRSGNIIGMLAARVPPRV